MRQPEYGLRLNVHWSFETHAHCWWSRQSHFRQGRSWGWGKKRPLSLSLLSNVHFQGPGLNVSEIIGAPRRYSLSS